MTKTVRLDSKYNKDRIKMTQFYMDVKIIEAYPIESDGKPGYDIRYQGGFVSWIPKDIFEATYFPIGFTPLIVGDKIVDKFIVEVTTDRFNGRKIFTSKNSTEFELREGNASINPELTISPQLVKKHLRDTFCKYLNFVFQWGDYAFYGKNYRATKKKGD